MARQYSICNRRARNANRRRCLAGLGSAAGAVVALGLAPLAAAPPAQADDFDVIIDPIVNAIAGGDDLAGVDPSAALADAAWIGRYVFLYLAV